MSAVARETRVFRIGIYELTAETGELRQEGKMRSRLQAQPLQVLLLLLERPAQVVKREELREKIWPATTFVDFDHGVNTAINKLRGALGDSASNSRFIQTLPRVGYRFIAPVEVVGGSATSTKAAPERQETSPDGRSGAATWGARAKGVLSQPADLPEASHGITRGLFIALEVMYLAFYVAALANVSQLLASVATLTRHVHAGFVVIIATAAAGIPLRLYLLSATAFRYRRLRGNFLKLFPYLLILDGMWALAPFLIAPYIGVGLALGATAALVYAPFAQRSLLLMSTREKHS